MTSLLFSLALFALFYGRWPGYILLPAAGLLFLALRLWGKKHRHTHGALLSIDAQAQRSPLGACHAGLKICFCLLCLFWCVGANSLGFSLFIAVSMAALTVGTGRVPLRYYLSLMAVPAVFILLGTVALLAEFSTVPLGLLDVPLGRWYLCVTPAGQRAALLLISRAFGAVSCLYLLSLSTPMHRIIAALRRAKAPALVIELMYLIYRYIFVLLQTQHQMQVAAGARLGYRDARTALKTTGAASLNLLFLSFRTSADCFAAMEARCYDGEIAFLESDQKLRAAELAFAACYLAVSALVWYFVRRLGL